jgi:hypothetical protein
VVQAILRSIAVDAAKGKPGAQRLYLNLLSGAEADRRVATMEVLKLAVEYKEHWGPILAERARTGGTGPLPDVHADDIIIDMDTGEVRVEGPVLEQQKRAYGELHARRPLLEKELKDISRRLESDPDNHQLLIEQKRITKILRFVDVDVARWAARQIVSRPRTKSKTKPGG